jgi:hypothetical protein
MLSHQQARNEIMGKKTIILNPTIEQKSGTEVVTFADGVFSSRIVASLKVGNLLGGYPRIDWNRTCPSHKLSHNYLCKDRFHISP